MSNKSVGQTTRIVPDSAVTAGDQTGTPFTRQCQGTCGQPIPANRLAAQPNARLCVQCLEAAGDVLPIKRFDETTGDGEQVQTLFTKDRRIERQMNHLNKSAIADQAAFDIAVGDDSHLGFEPNEILDGGRSLSTVFDDPNEYSPSGMGIVGRGRRAEKTAVALAQLPKAA